VVVAKELSVFVEIISDSGIGSAPIRLSINQIVIRQDNNTIIAVAAEYGMDKCQLVSHVGDDDFNEVLAKLGIHETTLCDTLQLPEPPTGARLISAP
jgi:hypothetical protein